MFAPNTALRKILACALRCLVGPSWRPRRQPNRRRGDPFAGAIFRTRDARTGRVSSWDKTGGNTDFLSFKAGETKELVRLDGPGVITHIYVTPGAGKAFLRNAVLRMYWDDEQNPSVEVPFGDFFCAATATRACSPRASSSSITARAPSATTRTSPCLSASGRG